MNRNALIIIALAVVVVVAAGIALSQSSGNDDSDSESGKLVYNYSIEMDEYLPEAKITVRLSNETDYGISFSGFDAVLKVNGTEYDINLGNGLIDPHYGVMVVDASKFVKNGTTAQDCEFVLSYHLTDSEIRSLENTYVYHFSNVEVVYDGNL